jgi:hypothetical protein
MRYLSPISNISLTVRVEVKGSTEKIRCDLWGSNKPRASTVIRTRRTRNKTPSCWWGEFMAPGEPILYLSAKPNQNRKIVTVFA